MTRHGSRFACLAALVLTAVPLGAQGLRDTFANLFVFGNNGIQLQLPGSADPNNPSSIQLHGNHFIPASVSANGSLIAFLGNAIAGTAASAPISAASAGTTFRFEGGVPVATSSSSGPLFAERAQTLGRGRVFVGFNQNHSHYESLRGVPMNDIRLIFTHENVTSADVPDCDATAGGDCNLMGVPKLENDIMLFNINLNVDVTVTSFFLTYGLTDRIDLSFALPVVSASLQGTSNAEIVPFGGPPVVHFFAGTSDNPVLSASQSVSGSATGIGDVAARLKFNVSQSARTGLALLVDARFPTGSEEDLLGTGHLAARALAIVSSRFGDFSPHANVGYLARTGKTENDALLTTIGFDHRMAPWATFAVDLISEFQVGANKFLLPKPVTYDSPFRRTIDPTSIPEIRDNLINGSVGMKFKMIGELTGVTNVIVPLNRAGLRPNLLWTFGAEYNY